MAHHCISFKEVPAFMFAKVKVKFTLEQATKAKSGVVVQLYSFHNIGARWRWVAKATSRPLNPRERPGTYCTGGWVGPRAGSGQGWKISPPTGIGSSDRPARSESLYRLSYPGPSFMFEDTFICDIVHTHWLFSFQQRYSKPRG